MAGLTAYRHCSRLRTATAATRSWDCPAPISALEDGTPAPALRFSTWASLAYASIPGPFLHQTIIVPRPLHAAVGGLTCVLSPERPASACHLSWQRLPTAAELRWTAAVVAAPQPGVALGAGVAGGRAFGGSLQQIRLAVRQYLGPAPRRALLRAPRWPLGKTARRCCSGGQLAVQVDHGWKGSRCRTVEKQTL